MSRVNKAHHHTHEQTVDSVTFKGVGGRRDEMSVWGLRGRIHTESVYFEDLSGAPPAFLDPKKDGSLITQVAGGIEVPTLPDEVVIATHVSVIHEDGGASGDFFTLSLWDFSGAVVATSPSISFGVGVLAVDCFIWDAPFTFNLCDGWGIDGTTGGSAANVRIRILLEFVTIQA